MHTLILKRNVVIYTVVLTGVGLLLLFVLIYGEAFRKALVEMKHTPSDNGVGTEVSAPVQNQTPENMDKRTAVTSPSQTAIDGSSSSKIPVTAVSSQAKQDSKQFFAQFRLERDRVRSQQIDLLREMVNSASTAAEARSDAQKRILDLTRQMEKEMELENLMVAKGYPEAAAFIQPESVTVVLFSGSLNPDQKKSVSGLAASMVGCTEDQVSIICRK